MSVLPSYRGLIYRGRLIQITEAPDGERELLPGTLVWVAGVVNVNAGRLNVILDEECGKSPEPLREATKSEKCETWLVEFLQEAEEPMKPKEIFEMAEDEGFRKRMVSQVRKKLGALVHDTEDRHSPANCWEWAGEV